MFNRPLIYLQSTEGIQCIPLRQVLPRMHCQTFVSFKKWLSYHLAKLFFSIKHLHVHAQ